MGITVRDLMEKIEVQGSVIIKQWNEEKETYDTLLEEEYAEFCDMSYDIKEMEINYLYAVDGNLTIEV